jgi:hypothetical protein
LVTTNELVARTRLIPVTRFVVALHSADLYVPLYVREVIKQPGGDQPQGRAPDYFQYDVVGTFLTVKQIHDK